MGSEMCIRDRSYTGNKVISNIALSIGTGQVFGLLGANGAGKTTTIECILGTRKADAGSVSILGLDPRKNRKQLFEQVGVQFQEASYSDKIKVWELCEETACLYRKAANYEELLRQFGLWEKRGAFVNELSGGQKQRLCIARALLKHPKVLILDDSTSAVDTATDAKIRKAFLTEIPETTKLIIAQRISSVQDADRIIVMENGKVNGFGSHEELLKTNEIYREVYESQTGGGGDFDEKRGE